MPPMNQVQSGYIPLCGLVDSDIYDGSVNFPFIAPGLAEGTQVMIPAGSPFIQMIPVKRDKWVQEIRDTEENKSISKNNAEWSANKTDFYKKNSWEKKNYN